MRIPEEWFCRDCEGFAGTATVDPGRISGPAEDCYPAEYVTEPPESCGFCGSDNLRSEHE